jgi:hypothetical protein
LALTQTAIDRLYQVDQPAAFQIRRRPWLDTNARKLCERLSDRGEIAMSIGTVTSLLLATALTVAIANVGQRLHRIDLVAGPNDCGANPGAACAATPRAEFQASRCSLPTDRDI